MSNIDFSDDFEIPLSPPQLEAESEQSIADLIMNAPPWDGNFSIELLALAKRYYVIRSLIGFPLELAQGEQQKLLTENDSQEIYRAQGGARALVKLNEIIFEGLKAAEAHLTAKIAQTEEEDNDQTKSPQYVP